MAGRFSSYAKSKTQAPSICQCLEPWSPLCPVWEGKEQEKVSLRSQSDSHHFCCNSVGYLWMQAWELGDRDSSWAATPLPRKRNTFWCIAVSLPRSYVVFSPRDQVMPLLGRPLLALFCHFTSEFLSWVSKPGYFGFSASRMGMPEVTHCLNPTSVRGLLFPVRWLKSPPTSQQHSHCCHNHLSAVVLKTGPQASSVSITQNLWKCAFSDPTPDLLNQNMLVLGPSSVCFNKPPKTCTPKFVCHHPNASAVNPVSPYWVILVLPF